MALTGTLVGAYRQRTEFSNSIFEFLPQNIYQQVVVFQIFRAFGPSVSFKVCWSDFRFNSNIALIPRHSTAPMGLFRN